MDETKISQKYNTNKNNLYLNYIHDGIVFQYLGSSLEIRDLLSADGETEDVRGTVENSVSECSGCTMFLWEDAGFVPEEFTPTKLGDLVL